MKMMQKICRDRGGSSSFLFHVLVIVLVLASFVLANTSTTTATATANSRNTQEVVVIEVHGDNKDSIFVIGGETEEEEEEEVEDAHSVIGDANNEMLHTPDDEQSENGQYDIDANEHDDGTETGHGEEGEEEIEPAFAILFPPFVLTVGVIVYFVLSRYLHALPYTAVMFFLGTLMGIAAAFGNDSFATHIHDSLTLWVSINSEVLLLVFLPGLIFKDSMGQNVYLFAFSIPQLLIFAFPMVLAGTCLTALIGYYVFPFGWSFNLAMTFGSILAATDPVAVAALLEEVGAPPRLKVHVAGESLLNDGSAIVFFSIFAERFFNELGVPGVGEDVDLRTGISMFCQKALGGVACGMLFGGLLMFILFMLDRRVSREENVVQVTIVLGIAYLNYYVSDFILKTSGVLATVTAGLILKLFGRAMVNDSKLLEDFLTLVEHILNTVLFALGGVVWGAVIADSERSGIWGPTEWGYLVFLYVMLQIIRFAQFAITYPLTVRIGLSTNWRETLFQIHGGLRGAVGIALAIALDNETTHAMGNHGKTPNSVQEIQTTQVFAMVGGIAFLSLVFNGITAGPLLRKLGLADSTEIRQKILEAYKARFKAHAVEDFVKLLSQKRFENVNFALVKHHVPYIADLTKSQLLHAIERHKETTLPEEYNAPYLNRVLPYLKDITDNASINVSGALVTAAEEEQILESLDEHVRKHRLEQRTKSRKLKARRRISSTMRYMLGGEPLSSQELRILFISILTAMYDEQVIDGELEDQHVLAIALEQSLEFAKDAIMNNGQPIRDFEYLMKFEKPVSRSLRTYFKENKCAMGILNYIRRLSKKRSASNMKSRRETLTVERSMAVMAAHKAAQRFFTNEFQNADSELSEAGKLIIEESKKQYNLAEKEIKALPDQKIVALVVSHKFCKILLNMGISRLFQYVKVGLLKESEAEHYIEEIEEHLEHVLSCDISDHPGEIDIVDENEILRQSVSARLGTELGMIKEQLSD